MSANREELHRLIDEIPESDLPAIHNYLRSVRDESADPVRYALDHAPLDDEPETEEERQAVEKGKADLKAGRVYTMEEAKRELGL